jgi:Flp pilus assembly protein TadG
MTGFERWPVSGGSRLARHEGGQVIVLFALALTVLIAAGGLALDTGGAWAQERAQQRTADLASLAGATAEANGQLRAGIISAAVASATANGYSAAEVTVNIPPVTGAYAPGGSQSGPLSTNDCSTAAMVPCWVQVVVTRPHQNSFASIVPGQGQWQVSARGVAVGGIANAAYAGAAPVMFDESAVRTPPNDAKFCNVKKNGCPSPNDPVPINPNQFAWTEFCVKGDPHCNFDSNTGKELIAGQLALTVTVGMDLGPNNGGQQDDVCRALLAAYPNGGDIVVAISTPSSTDPTVAVLAGIWVFHFDPTLTDCTGPNAPIIGGTFVSDATSTLPLTILPGGGTPQTGEYIARLVE